MHICPRLMELLHEKGLDDVLVVVGGIIPDVDIPKLQATSASRASSCPARRCRRSSTSSRPTSGRAWSTSRRMAHKLLLADDSVTIQRVIELTFADEDVAGRRGRRRQAGDRADRVAIARTSSSPTSACRSATATRSRRSSRTTRGSRTSRCCCWPARSSRSTRSAPARSAATACWSSRSSRRS